MTGERLKEIRDTLSHYVGIVYLEKDELLRIYKTDVADLLAERDALRAKLQVATEALANARNRLSPLCAAVAPNPDPKPLVEKPPFKDSSEQIAELSRLMILHGNEAKRFALIGKDIDDIAAVALAAIKQPEGE